jgi:hypothetical protein
MGGIVPNATTGGKTPLTASFAISANSAASTIGAYGSLLDRKPIWAISHVWPTFPSVYAIDAAPRISVEM